MLDGGGRVFWGLINIKRVLQISSYLYPHIGGIEQTTHDIAVAINSSNATKQKIICFNEDATDGDYVCRRKETVHDKVYGVQICSFGTQVLDKPNF